MPFDPITWMVSFSLTRVAGRFVTPSKDAKLTKNLRRAIEDWAKNNDPPVRPDTLDAIFSPDVDESQPERFAARHRLSETMLKRRVPPDSEISDALLERWDEIRAGIAERDVQEFFRISRDVAANQLSGLADRIRMVLGEDPRLFQNTVLDFLKTLGDSNRQQPDDDAPVFTVPYQRHTCFKGRQDILANLRRSLVGHKKAALTQVIRGLGGIGKTQTAVEYAYQHRDQYKAVLWIKAATDLEIRQDMADAARLLKLPHDETQLEEAVRALKYWLARNTDWLLIFDNADHPERLKPFLPPTSEGHILLTSRADVFSTLGILTPIELPLLSVEDAAQFLLERTQRDATDDAQVESARELANELGLLPLALEQAGAYIHELGLSFPAYLERYRKRHLEFLEHGKPAMGDYPESVATTWLINFKEVESESEASADLFRLTAFLSPDNIPFELILRGVSATDSSLVEAIADSDDPVLTLRETLRPLTRFSLFTTSSKTESYATHRLIQEAVKHSLGDSGCRTWAERTVAMLDRAFPSVEFKNWDSCRRLVSHVAVGARQAEALAIQFPTVARLADLAASFLHEQAQFAEAEPLCRQSMEITRVAFGEQHPNFATCLNNLAGLYQAMGRLNEAGPLYKQSMEIRRIAFGEQHLSFANSVNNLGTLYMGMGQHAKAEQLYKQLMDFYRLAPGERGPYFVISLNNLAECYRTMGRYTEAEPLYSQSMEIWRNALGEQHPNFATSLNNLALLYWAMGRLADAEPLFTKSMEIRRVALGEQHPDFATSLNNLGALYRAMGRHSDAEPLLKQSMEIKRVALGEQHPGVATSLDNLADLYQAMGRHVEAEPLYKQSMEIRRVALGEQHPDFASSVAGLADLFLAMGRHAEAEPLYKQSREIIRVVFGEQHRHFATSLSSLASLYRTMRRYAEAEPLFKQSMEVTRVARGEQHPDYACRLNNLGILYGEMGRTTEAEPLHKQAMEIARVALGEQHPNFATSRNNLAKLYRATGRHAEADELETEADS